MKEKSFLFFTAISMTIILAGCQGEKQLQYPETRMGDVVDTYFGVQVADPYSWLEDDNSEETKAWVQAQNKVTFDYLGGIRFRDQIRERLTALWDFERYSAPFWKDNTFFYYKNDGMQNHSVLYVKEGLHGQSRVLLDPNQLSEDGTVSISSLSISDDGRYLAYGISRGGSDWNEIFVREIATGNDLQDHIRWVKFSGIAWKGNGFYYSRYDQPAPGMELSAANEYHKIYYHTLGDLQDQDELVFENRQHPRRNMGAQTTEDERFLIISETQSTSGNSLIVKDLTKPESRFVTIIDGFRYTNWVIDNIGGELLVLTNHNAPRYRLVLIDPARPAPANWREIIPQGENVLSGVSLVNGKIISSYLQDAYSKAYIHDLDGNLEAEMKLPGLGTLGGISGKKDEELAFFTFSSYINPSTVFRFDVQTNEYQAYFSPEIDFNPQDYETRQVFYTSKDGTRVPMFITHKKGLKMDGSNPTILYGYGGFNISMTPGFSIARVLWLEQGGIYAVANIRGGGEYGRPWHEAGTKLQKQNVFDDFIAAAEYLIQESYTSPEKLAIEGGSNGGLLVGAVANQRPELFKVALPAVGVMDMLKFHKFTIGWAWVDDYGSSDNEEEFHYLYGYSPLHNIREGVNYPATLVTTADHDDRVVPAHSFKYIAQLQRNHRGPNPVLIRIETKAGHGAGKPTSMIIEEVADALAFTWYNMGIRPRF